MASGHTPHQDGRTGDSIGVTAGTSRFLSFGRGHRSASVYHVRRNRLTGSTMGDGTYPMAGNLLGAMPGNWPCPQTVGPCST
jgi:hypothetical protein